MSPPGPPGALWAVSLVLWAAAAAVLGEATRGIASRWLSFWRTDEPIERLVTDLYVGGGTMYLVAAVQLGAFTPSVVRALPIVAAGWLVYRVYRERRSGLPSQAGARFARQLANRWVAVALLSSLGLYLVELLVALPVPTGNTLDSSLLTTYTALLLQHGSVPLSFQPYGAHLILYPQGSTVWFAWAQQTFGLPPARTALLVTPLFLALPPLSGYVVGRRWLHSPRAGAAFAVALAFLGPSTRALAAGSNDFVLATPLVLLLAARARIWFDGEVPSMGDALGFGLLLGYAGALNVVGAEWLFPALLLLGLLARPRFGGRWLRWGSRWLASVGVALVAGAPSIYVLADGLTHPGTFGGALSAPARAPVGVSAAQLVGSLDPFLFGHSYVSLSPIPIVRAELAGLLVLGAALLLLGEASSTPDPRWQSFARWAGTCALAASTWLVLLYLAGRPGSPLRVLPFVSNSQELSMWVFLLYGLVAAVPLAVAFEGRSPFEVPRPADAASRVPRPRTMGGSRLVVPVVFAIVVVVPGVVLTPTSLGPVLTSTYRDFGNVSASDFALLADAPSLFAPGARVLVAPGSAAQFLPGYATGIVLVYPMAPGWSRANASYNRVVAELSNGTLDVSGRQALANLSVDFVVVTGNNSVLWPAFWAAPLRAAEVGGMPTFPVVWREGDAWVFDASACRPGSSGCS